MPQINWNDKYYHDTGTIGFPEDEVLEETLHDGKRKKKIAQLIVVHHKSGKVGYKLNIDEKLINKDGIFYTTTHIPLDEQATEQLFKYLLSRDSFADLVGSTFYSVVESVAPLDEETVGSLIKLLKRAVDNKQLEKVVPSEIANNFGAVIQQILYRKALTELNGMLLSEHSEKEYENWFLDNHWVFGTEYIDTANVKIGWKTEGDIILSSTDGYQDIIELKLPDVEIFVYDRSHNNYCPSSDLSKAMAQAMKYIQESEDVRLTILAKEKLPFLRPRARIVIGRSSDWEAEKLNALRVLNTSLHNIEVMTYDHLLARANRMIKYYETRQ